MKSNIVLKLNKVLKFIIRYLQTIIPIFLTICLSSCASLTKPALSPKIQEELAQIDIDISSNSLTNNEFYPHIQNLLNSHNTSKQYLLKTTLQYNYKPLIILPNANTTAYKILSTAYKITLYVTYALLDRSNNIIMTNGHFNLMNNYHTFNGLYASYNEKIETEIQLSKAAAERVFHHLILYLGKQQFSKYK